MRHRYNNGKDYSHRKDWVTERLALLANTFAIDVCAYALLDNHLLKINAQKAKSWTDNDVIQGRGTSITNFFCPC